MLSKLLEFYGLAGAISQRCSWLAHLPLMQLSLPMLQSAVSAVCLVHAGGSARNISALDEGRRRYTSVVGSLIREIDRPHSTHEDIILTIMLIDLCDGPLQNRRRTIVHYIGAQQFIATHGLANFDLSNTRRFLMLTKLRKVSLLTSISQRKELVTTHRKSNVCKAEDPSNHHSVSFCEWLTLAMPLASLLERTDELMAEQSTTDQFEPRLTNTCEAFETLRFALIRDLYTNKVKPEIVAIKNDTNSNIAIEEHRFMAGSAASSIIRTFYRFIRFHMATRHVLTWLVCLVIDCSLLRLIKARPFTRLIPSVTRTPDKIQEDAFEHAKNICRSIYFFSGMESIAHAHFVDVLLLVTSSFFAEIHAKPELWWVQTCRKASRKRVRRMENAGHKTLCRVSGVSRGLADAVRFESFGKASETKKDLTEAGDAPSCPLSGVVSLRCKHMRILKDEGEDNRRDAAC